MIVHQHISVNARAETLRQLAQQLQKTVPVGILPEDRLPIISPECRAKATPGQFQPQWPSHTTGRIPPAKTIKSPICESRGPMFFSPYG